MRACSAGPVKNIDTLVVGREIPNEPERPRAPASDSEAAIDYAGDIDIDVMLSSPTGHNLIDIIIRGGKFNYSRMHDIMMKHHDTQHAKM